MNNQRRSQSVNNDTLEFMFDKQKQFQNLITGKEYPCIDYEGVVYAITGMIAEVGEVLQADKNWKNWSKTKKEVDREKLLDEVVDVWHFLVNMSLSLGFDYSDIKEQFEKKNEVNFKRQESGY